MITLHQIEQTMIRELGYDFTTMKSKERQNVYIRSIFFKLAKELTKHSLAYIGKYLNKDHATVLHGFKVFERQVKVYEPKLFKVYKNSLDRLKPQLVDYMPTVKDVNLLEYGIRI